MERAKILIVDDDPDLRRAMKIRLRANYYDTVQASDGYSAIAMAQKERPDLIILDLGLPAGDGFGVLKRLQDADTLSNIPVIVLSTSTRAEDIAKAYILGANCYISKPADLESLVEVARTIEAFWLGTAALVPEVNLRPQLLASRKTA